MSGTEFSFIDHLQSNKYTNIFLLLSGKFHEFMERNKNAAGLLQHKTIWSCYNMVPPETHGKFMTETYLNSETLSIWDNEPVHICSSMLAVNSRKPATGITKETFEYALKINKNVLFDPQVTKELLLTDFNLKKSRLVKETENYIRLNKNKSFQPCNVDEAITKAFEFFHEKKFRKDCSQDMANLTQNDFFTIKCSVSISWLLMLKSIGEYFYRLIGRGAQSSECRYLQIKLKDSQYAQFNDNFGIFSTFNVYLSYGGAPRATLVSYDKVDRCAFIRSKNYIIRSATFVVTCNSVETLIHEIYHCIQFCQEFAWNIPFDCLEAPAICMERAYRNEKSKDYSPFRQILQIAYSIAALNENCEKFDQDFNKLMELPQSASFSRQFIPILTNGSYYYSYALGFIDFNILPEEYKKKLSLYCP